MTKKKIIVAYDGSDSSNKALTLAADLCAAIAGELLLVSVAERPSELFTFKQLEHDREEASKAILRNGEQHAATLGVAIKPVLLCGSPAEEVIRFAGEQQAYVIVVGTRSLAGLQRLMLGSVAQALVNNSSIPVLVAK